MKGINRQIAAGHYARKQLLGAYSLVAWSHRSRFKTALRLARRIRAKRVLDYGCGDGTFLALLMQGPYSPAQGVGAEITSDLVLDCQRRLDRPPSLTFLDLRSLERSEHLASYDLVVCMEVLEHVVERRETIDQLVNLMAENGTLLVSVPVEIGPAVVVKQSARRALGWLGIGDYPGSTPYQWRELLQAMFAGDATPVQRPIHRAADGRQFYDHKGFNWRLVATEIAERLRIEEVHTSPIAGLPPALASQVWFIARKGPLTTGHPKGSPR